ncbi:MAG: ATP-grasp domain-containing protein [Alphaproteobacteria bacterium]|nr:ATP-grasp domain-containing protein [Alphaproteobacteria bacterium]MDE2012876.1 ATP-grasp domain-containing protein [Alphaproteobacteria bacterium]MDE2073416.1 ATP-grasp domain-containing protein [Alphaproteobacteria bacterium]MDE2350711.1 ATP-grasp domain-containing protein [Alphaproteobacteria bacterium]
MDKAILIVSGGIEAAEAARHAKEMGLYVVVSDRDPEAPGFAYADSCIIADVYGPEETAAAALRYSRKIRKIDGVICVAADAPVTVATVAEKLGLPGIPLDAARTACDKLAMKQRFRAAGVPVPWFAEVATPQDLQRIAIERGRDLVIKPVDSRGSRGVQRVAQVEDLAKAFMFARQHSPTERVMVEQYLSGPQVSTESVIVEGRCFTPGFSDRNYEYLDRYAPFFIENGGDLPSHLAPAAQAKVKQVVARAAAALGIVNGTVKGDIVVHEGEPYVIELAARLSGGFFCTREIPLNTGVDFIGAAIRVALGECPSEDELTPQFLRPVIQRYAFPSPGRVVSIAGAESARRIPGIEEVVVTVREGDVIPAAGDKRPSAAMVLATGATRADAVSAANDALAQLRIQTA